MTFITKKALARRTFLRGLGTTLALPLLDSMVPALSASSLKPVPRLGFVYVSNGIIQNQFNPTVDGTKFELPRILQPLAPVREYINVISGLAHRQADAMGDAGSDHPRASAVWLSGVHAWDRTQPGIEVKLGVTADQLAAQQIGKDSPVSSLELSVDNPTQGSCDSGDCFYEDTISWRNPTTPNLTEENPRVVFHRLFGDGGTGTQRLMLMKKTDSILDSVVQEVNGLALTLGAGDRSKLTEYMDSVRDIEKRIQHAETQSAESIEAPERPAGIPDTFEEHVKLMYDLQTIAFRADITRVFTMIMSRETSPRTFPNIGVPEQHHPVSHHRNDPELIEKKAKIDTYLVQLFAYFVQKLQATPDGDGNLLDHSLLTYGGGMGDGNLHRHWDLPCLLVGKLGGQFQTGRHLTYPENTPMSNLLVTILHKAGVPVEKLGDSTGELRPDYLSV